MPSHVSMGTDICVPNPARHHFFPRAHRGHSCLSLSGIGILACVLSVFFPAAAVTSTAAPTPLITGFAVLPDDSGPWPQILSSVGFQKQSPADAGILVLRPGGVTPSLTARIGQGAFLILEGQSATAEQFGFRATKDRINVGSVEDIHRPKLPVIWQKAVQLPRFEIPRLARVFAKDRWTGAPLIAGYASGRGAILWVAANPGDRGYERLPYIVHALQDLGLNAPFRSHRLWAFFDYSYRLRVDLEYFAARWRASGISALHVAAWHFYDADPQRDKYLKSLIETCHRHGILVYAWIELPHVSEQFWNLHPEWREKTAVLQDAQLDWRKLMNLANPDCFLAASAGIKDLINRFDWDGLNLAELYFESLEGAANPARFTPMNDDVRREFRAARGFDPVALFQSRKDTASLRSFLDFRASLARRMQEQWIAELETIRGTRPDLDLVLTHVDDRFDSGMKDAIGADAAAILPLLDTHDFTFLIEDPATVWNLGPQRYPEIAKRYQPLTPRAAKLAIDINIVDRYQDVYPTKQQTGTELFELIHLASSAFPRVALYFENSILAPDLRLLPATGTVISHLENNPPTLTIDSPYGVGISWNGDALVDGRSWPVTDGSTLWLPAGLHTIEPAPTSSAARILDFNGELRSAVRIGKSGIEFSYESSSRALAVVDRKPTRIEIDGAGALAATLAGDKAYIISLPRGQHVVGVQMD
jgi:hypothetical protein